MIIVSSVATWIMNIINNRMTFRTVQDIRAKAIRHIQELPLSYLDSHSTGDIISRVIADTDILSDGLNGCQRTVACESHLLNPADRIKKCVNNYMAQYDK